ncbi:sensor histidine kinase [Paenibacillus donghaensis]|uniref:histidine kinase n=1 Tax=Paenibacillus donghaensis TaxID=414771 RepID=A0A2Z2KHA0_9BACL|nr:HAMP domain-containing sensor histidine kinase [Paenibacillus donghaensis]ASA22550.1 hypothetical protein B9T62_18235 [Paenibacillus donghaensis]
MKLKQRLTWQFLLWLLLLIVMCLALLLGVQRFLILKLERGDSYDVVQAMSSIAKRITAEGDGTLRIDGADLKELNQHGYWLQVLNDNGMEAFSYQRPADMPEHYAPGELVHYLSPGAPSGYLLQTWFNPHSEGSKWTWIAGKKAGAGVYFSLMDGRQLALFGFIVAGGFAAMLLSAYWFGRRLGSPLLHMMNWIQALAGGVYAEPAGRSGRPASLRADGSIHSSFRLYHEVTAALSVLTRTLDRNQAELIQLQRNQEEWMAAVSHDLMTPLASIQGYSELLASSRYEWELGEVRTYAQTIFDKSEYLKELIEDFNLTFRLKSDGLPLKRRSCDLVELVRRAAIDAANDPRNEAYLISFDTDRGSYYCELDTRWFRRALDNLLANALKHNPKGTHIHVEVLGPVIMIRDDGDGMDPETLSRLFQRYYRGTGTQEKTEGTGLGMVIAHQLIVAHGGSIAVSSALGEGTTITVALHKQLFDET